MNKEMMQALKEIERQKGISAEVILETLEAALVSAYKKNYPDSEVVVVNINRETGEIRIYNKLTVVDEYSGDLDEILIEDALEINPDYKLGDVISQEVNPADFGRIAAQTAKQVVVQRIREAERNAVLGEYKDREGEIVTGIVQRENKGNVFVSLGKIEAVLPFKEQVPGENYTQNIRLKVLIKKVESQSLVPQITLSRLDSDFVKRLFEFEVPEIYDGVVEIKSVSREAGFRTKIAVYTSNPDIDALGACVGQKGVRVQAIVDELRGEKIDIINYSEDPAEYISNALSPSSVSKVIISEEEENSSLVVVPDNQLSLAIGKEGQNARLAARLTGWRIDIKSESKYKEYLEALELGDTKENVEGIEVIQNIEVPVEENVEEN